jgi:hypothetical protein
MLGSAFPCMQHNEGKDLPMICAMVVTSRPRIKSSSHSPWTRQEKEAVRMYVSVRLRNFLDTTNTYSCERPSCG